MKKLVLVLLLLPLVSFANEEPKKQKSITIFKKQCEDTAGTSQAKKNCLSEEKQKEASENFKNFQENNHQSATF